MTKLVALGMTPLVLSSSGQAEPMKIEETDWSYLTGGFREKHHFGFLAGTGWADWYFANVLPQGRQAAQVQYSAVRYLYFLPFYRRFGYSLGTSVGYSSVDFELADLGRLDILRFPGVSAGLTLELTRYIRANGIVEYQLERWNGLTVDQSERIHVSVPSLASRYFLEYFFALKWSVLLEAVDRRSFYSGTKESKGLGISSIVKYHERNIGLGIHYHFL